jgi:hypothetical protein
MPSDKNFLGDLPTWVTAIATLLLAALALFQDFFRRLVWKPKLELEVHPRPPDFHRTEWTYSVLQRVHDVVTNKTVERTVQMSSPCYYFRVRVTNKGNCEAKDVEVYAKELQELEGGEFRSVPRFSPMDLLWADVRTPVMPNLIPELPKLCDLAHIVAPSERDYLGHDLPGVDEEQSILALDLQVTPNSKGHLIGPGHYRLTLALAAANATPSDYVLDITVTGDWYDEPDRMFVNGVRFHLRNS